MHPRGQLQGLASASAPCILSGAGGCQRGLHLLMPLHHGLITHIPSAVSACELWKRQAGCWRLLQHLQAPCIVYATVATLALVVPYMFCFFWCCECITPLAPVL